MKLFSFIMIAGLILGSSVAGAGTIAGAAGKEVITAGQIETAGLTRLSDILLLADNWTAVTRDGFDYQASANGLAAIRNQGWLVMVDGQLMDIRLFDSINLNLLPVSLAVVDSVEVISLPLLYRGVFTDRGLIHIHTRRPAAGLAMTGEVVAGNETGDPGPYAYTGLSSPNIDATGPDAAAALGYNYRHVYLQATASTAIHFFRDPAMLERNTKILNPPANQDPRPQPAAGWQAGGRPAASSVLGRLGLDDVNPGMRKLSASLRAGRCGSSGRHEFQAGYTETERYFLFVSHLGRELPVNSRLAQVGLSGNKTIGSASALNYRLNYLSHSLEKYPNFLDADLDWDQRMWHLALEGTYGQDDLGVTAGISWDRMSPKTRYALADKQSDLLRLYASVRFITGRSFHQSAGLSTLADGDRAVFQTYLTSGWQLHPAHSFQLHLSFSERLPGQDPGLRYWTQQGLVNPADFGLVYGTSDYQATSSQLTADLTWQAQAAPGLEISTTASIRFFDDLYLETYAFTIDSTSCSFSSPVYGHALQSGSIGRFRLSARHRLSPGWSHLLSYSYQADLSGDPFFIQAWNTTPKHRASYRMTYRSGRNVDLWGMLSYLSSSSWLDYAFIDGVSCDTRGIRTVYHSTVDGSLSLDLQVQKWFWQRRLRGELLCRNVWNETVKYHPVGGSFDLMFWAGLRLQLGRY